MRTLIILIILASFALVKADIKDIGTGESASGFLTSLPPGTPQLLTPSDATQEVPDTVTIAWRSLPHAASFTVQISKYVDFSECVTIETGADTSQTLRGLPPNTTFYWRVKAFNVAGGGTFSSIRNFKSAIRTFVDQDPETIPASFALLPAYPNPFNPSTTISYHLPKSADVTLIIYNTMGQSVRKLVSERQAPGRYALEWDGNDINNIPVTSGIYLCVLRAGNSVIKQKLLLTR